MPDPQVLYVVTAVVVLALVAWVITVLTRARDLGDAKGAAVPATASPLTAGGTAAALPMGEPKEAGAANTIPSPPVDMRSSSRPSPVPGGSIDRASAARQSSELQVDVEEEEEPTGPYALILISAVGRTDPGLKRKHNEDAYIILERHHLFAIADGMGRHAAGEVASKLAVDAIGEAYTSGAEPSAEPDGTLPRRANQLRSAILLANERIYTQSREVDEYAGMGTTVVACYFSPNNQRVYIAHVGDSRCYRVRGGTLKQLTKDHTLGAVGIQGKSSSVLSRAVGVEERVDVDLTMESPLPGDVYLLCSDGLSRMVTDAEIEQTLNSTKDLDSASKKLIDLANARGGRDNITTIVVRVEDAPRITTSPPRGSA